MNVIELKRVSKIYKLGEVDIHALRHTDLKIKKGGFYSLTGPSGCGKSTLLHLMGALDRPTHGSVKIGNEYVESMSDNELANVRGKKIGFIFQTFNLIPKISTLDNVMLPRQIADLGNAREKAEEMLEKVGLEDRMYSSPTQLSGGQRQRVAIARALVNEPEIILADEPTGNLDSKTGKEIIDLFRKLHKEGNTFIIVTHDPEIASKAKRKIKMKDGNVIRSG